MHAVKLRAPKAAGTPPPDTPSGPTGGGNGQERLRAKLNADAMRQAESAAMLIAITRMLLDLRGRDFATWLRSIADDFEATDPDTEHAEDLAEELLRRTRGASRGSDACDGQSADTAPDPAIEPGDDPLGRFRRH